MAFEDFDEFHHPPERGERPDADTAALLAKLESHYGSHVVAKRIGVSKESVARYIARLPMFASTLRKIRSHLEREGKR